MTPIGDMVGRLIAAGAPPELAASVVAEAFAAGAMSAEFRRHPVDETAERRRAKDRDRKRLIRGNPPMSADVCGIPPTRINNSSSQQKDSIEKEEKKLRRKTLLSAEFQPKPSHIEAAKKLGYPNPEQAVADKFEDMRLWAESKGVMRPGWDATLHGFLRRDAPKIGQQANGKTSPNGLSQALKSLGEHIDEIDRGEEGGQAPPRLLSRG